MKVPRGRLVRQRVVNDLGTPLERVLEDRLTGYARLESQDALLLDADGEGVLTFEDGVPMAAYHTGTDNGGPAALTDVAVAGPYRLELYELDRSDLTAVHDESALKVPPELPAKQLAGDPGLVDVTKSRAPDGETAQRDTGTPLDAVESFLDDEEAISSLRDRARTEAKSKADEWGFDIPE